MKPDTILPVPLRGKTDQGRLASEKIELINGLNPDWLDLYDEI